MSAFIWSSTQSQFTQYGWLTLSGSLFLKYACLSAKKSLARRCFRELNGSSRTPSNWEKRKAFPCFGAPAHGKILPCASIAVSYTHLRAHETVLDLVCRLLLEK